MGLNIKGNGQELWRRIYSEYAGSDKLLQIAGRTKLRDYGQCKNMKHLSHHVDDWTSLFYQYGDGIRAEHAKTMVVRTLPDTIRVEVYRRPEVEALGLFQLIDWVRHQTLFERTEDIIQQHLRPEKINTVVP